MHMISIQVIEHAINFYCAAKPSDKAGVLCSEARDLANVYGSMIFNQKAEIASEELPGNVRALILAAK